MIALSLELVNFVESLHLRPVKLIAESFERLGKWLTDRVKQADAIELRSRGFPVIRFYNGAVVLWIDPIQKDALAPDEPPMSFGDHLRAAGRRFVAGLKDVVALPEEARIIPDFLDSLSAALRKVLESIQRFRTPTREMFDGVRGGGRRRRPGAPSVETSARTASDLFGEAALAFRVLASSKSQLIGETGEGGFVGVVRQLMGPRSTGPTGPLESAAALPDLFERLTRYIVGALYLIPAIPELVQRIWKEASIFLRAKVIEVLADIEKDVFGVRRDVIDLFYVDLRDSLRDGLAFAEAYSTAAVGYVSLFVGVGAMFSNELISSFRTWFDDLRTFIRRMIDVYAILENLLAELVEIDVMGLLTPILAEKLGFAWSVVTTITDVPTLKIGELAEQDTRTKAYKRFDSWLNKIKRRLATIAGVIGGILGGAGAAAYIESKLKPLRKVLRAAIGTPTKEVEETSAFKDLTIPGLPDIGSILTTWIKPIRGSVTDFIGALGKETKDIVDKGTETIEAIGVRFDRAAASALRGPAARDYLAISEKAAALAEKAFPGEEAAGPGPGAALIDIAKDFDAWVARAGIEVAGAALPGYLIEMRRTWEDRRRRGEEATVRLPEELPPDFPTSPHIMAIRPALGRTLVPRITIHARGRALDDALVAEVADAVLSGVQDAHRGGLKVLSDLQAASGV